MREEQKIPGPSSHWVQDHMRTKSHFPVTFYYGDYHLRSLSKVTFTAFCSSLAVAFKSWCREENYKLTQFPLKVLTLCLGVGNCRPATSEWLFWEKKGENRDVIENSAFAGLWSERLAFSLLGQHSYLASIAGTRASSHSKQEKRWVDGRNIKRLFFLAGIYIVVYSAWKKDIEFLNSCSPVEAFKLSCHQSAINFFSLHTPWEKEKKTVWKKKTDFLLQLLMLLSSAEDLVKRESGGKISPEVCRKLNPTCNFHYRK